MLRRCHRLSNAGIVHFTSNDPRLAKTDRESSARFGVAFATQTSLTACTVHTIGKAGGNDDAFSRSDLQWSAKVFCMAV